jgi:hypothetical protein
MLISGDLKAHTYLNTNSTVGSNVETAAAIIDSEGEMVDYKAAVFSTILTSSREPDLSFLSLWRRAAELSTNYAPLEIDKLAGGSAREYDRESVRWWRR